MNFTPELLNATLEKYVFRTKYTEKDKEYVLKQSDDSKNFEPEKTLKYLIENSEGRLDIYAPAEELLKNLQNFVNFPKNSQFLGIRENCLNFEDTHRIYNDNKKHGFMLKCEVPLYLYQNLKSCNDDGIYIVLLEAYGNELYRKLKDTFEYVAKNIVEIMYKETSQTVADWILIYGDKINKNFVDYKSEVYSIVSKIYYSENDLEFRIKLWEQLEITVKNKPIKSNPEYYEKVLSRCQYLAKFMNLARIKFPFIFQPNPKIDKNFPHFPVIRVFKYLDQKYVFVKDLEFALINYENVKINVETTEERKNGIISTMKYDAFKNILNKAGITEKDLNIIPSKIQTTKHNIDVPILTSYGTHCKLVNDAFRDIFRVFSIDINWFNTVSEKNLFKMTIWFNSLSDIFSYPRKRLYFIDVWKIQELKDQIYDQFKKYTRKSKYDPPNIERFMTKDQMYEEIEKFGTNIQMIDECWKTLWLDTEIERNMSKWDILKMYDDYCLFQFTLETTKITKFMGKHLDYIVVRNEYRCRGTPEQSIITPTSHTNRNISQIPKFYNRLDAHRVKFSKEYIYSMSTLFSEGYYENETSLKLALDKTIVDESVKSKLISLVYNAEIRKFKNKRKSLFYLTEDEFFTFCETTNRRFDEVMKENRANPMIGLDLSSCATEAEKRREIRKTWKTHFPIDQYSYKFLDSAQEILKNEKNIEEMMIVALKARRIFEECSEKIRSFKDYCRENKERTIVMRIMSEMRIDNFDEWHMFSEEVLEAIEVVLENEGRLDTMKDQIAKWRQNWINGDNFSTITIKLLNTILNVVGIEASKFVCIADVQFFKNYMKLPLKTGYNAMKVLSPDGREVYHQVQAQFLIFQYGACDVFWNSDDRKAKNKHKKKVMEEMKKIGKGYTLAEIVEESARRVMYSDVAQKTVLSALHGKWFDDLLTKEETQRFNKFLPHTKLMNISAYQCKAFLMVQTLVKFMRNNLDKVIRKNIHKAFTMVFGFIYTANNESFDRIYDIGLKKGFGLTMDNMINLATRLSEKNAKSGEKENTKLEYLMAHLMKIIETGNIKNESACPTYDAKELVEQHYLFDESDPLGTYAKDKKGTQRGRNFGIRRKVVEEDELMMKLMNLIPKALVSISDEDFQPIDKLWEVFVDYIQKEFDEEEAVTLCEGLKMIKKSDSMKTKLGEMFDVTIIDRIDMYKRKKVEDPEKKVKPKKEEAPKVVVKYVTETKTVENCVNCRSIEKETMGFMRKIEKLEKENEENRRIIRQNEEDLAMLKSQISQNKLKYREEIQKHKEDVEGREVRIEQLNQEIKEFREDSRVEREALYAEVRKSSRIAAESVKKMKIELENSKFLETAKNKKIDELTAENSQLKTSLEISEENRAESESARKEAESRVKILEKQIEEMTLLLEDSISEEDLYLDSKLNVGPFEEILRFDVYGILDKIRKISDIYGISKSEIIRFQRRYDMYIRIVENENCWETAEIPDFPIPFSSDFMQRYESCLKRNIMVNLDKMAWSNCTYTFPNNNFVDLNQAFLM